jgi:hypothetical protein
VTAPLADRSAQARRDEAYDRSVINVDTGDGWVSFAGVLLGIAGVLNIIGGIAAIDDAKFYVRNAEYVIGSLHTWGWASLLLGILELVVAWGVFSRSQWARWTGVFVLSVNAITQLLSISSYPFWSLAIFTLDLLALYGLVAYGQRLERA